MAPTSCHNMLSSRLLRHPACQSLSKSSVNPFASRCRRPARTFHASAPRRDPILDTLLYLPHEMFSLIHTHAPWYAAIPLMAFITRGLLVTTAGARARALTARYIGLEPLRQALAVQKAQEVRERGGFRHPKEAMAQVKKEVNVITKDLDKRWDVSIWSQINWTFAQVPLFFGMAEVIRQKCGAHNGLMGMGFAAFRGNDATAAAGEVFSTSGRYFEPSLADEGMLWFPDLLLPDPTGILPFVVSGLMFANIYFTPNTPKDAGWSTVLRRTLLCIALLIGPLCQHVPAALVFYWASSTSSVIIWNFWLDWKYPAPRGYTACSRPLKMPPTTTSNRRRI